MRLLRLHVLSTEDESNVFASCCSDSSSDEGFSTTSLIDKSGETRSRRSICGVCMGRHRIPGVAIQDSEQLRKTMGGDRKGMEGMRETVSNFAISKLPIMWSPVRMHAA
jgi:hypothetical protein